jgi:hypothetical protein
VKLTAVLLHLQLILPSQAPDRVKNSIFWLVKRLTTQILIGQGTRRTIPVIGEWSEAIEENPVARRVATQ